MKTKIFTPEEMKKIRVSAIAGKYNCSVDYVRRVLLGGRDRRTLLSLKVVQDAIDMLAVIERETTITA